MTLHQHHAATGEMHPCDDLLQLLSSATAVVLAELLARDTADANQPARAPGAPLNGFLAGLARAGILPPPPEYFDSTHAPAAGIGELLRSRRRTAGLTQEELAERAGLSPRTISELECGGSHVPRRDTVALLVEALGLSDHERAELDAMVTRRRGPRPLVRPPMGVRLDPRVLASGRPQPRTELSRIAS